MGLRPRINVTTNYSCVQFLSLLSQFITRSLPPNTGSPCRTHWLERSTRPVANWSCRSVYRRQDVCVAKVILWILSSCTYWWENRYPPHTWLMAPPPIVGWWPPHTWLMTPPYLTDGPPILGWWPPHSWLMTPPPILAWCPPWLDDVLSQVGFSSVCAKAGPHETCAAGTSFHWCWDDFENSGAYRVAFAFHNIF